MTLAMPEFDGSGVVAACPPSAYTDEWVVVLELWDTIRRRIIWTVGTIGEDPTTRAVAFAPDESYDSLQEALEAFTATLSQERGA